MWAGLRESTKGLQSTLWLATAENYYLPKLVIQMKGALLEMKKRERLKSTTLQDLL